MELKKKRIGESVTLPTVSAECYAKKHDWLLMRFGLVRGGFLRKMKRYWMFDLVRKRAIGRFF